MVWYSHLLKNFPEFVVIHTVKGFGIVNTLENFVQVGLTPPHWIPPNLIPINRYRATTSPIRESYHLGTVIDPSMDIDSGQTNQRIFSGTLRKDFVSPLGGFAGGK